MANAEIIISESPARSTRLAAAELQTYVAKISGARLSIRAEPSADVPVQIYVGESTHAAKLGVAADRLEHGAYSITSGEKWLALIGDNTDFTPKEPCAKNNSGRGEKLHSEWEEASGLPFAVPNGWLYKYRERTPEALAKEEREYLWLFDERGLFNAVCGYLEIAGSQNRLFAYIVTLVGNRDSARDVLQETNIVLWQKRNDFELGTSFRAWSY